MEMKGEKKMPFGNIYPNPFDRSIYIDLLTETTNQIIIDMVDMNGRVIQLRPRAGMSKYRLSMAGKVRYQ